LGLEGREILTEGAKDLSELISDGTLDTVKVDEDAFEVGEGLGLGVGVGVGEGVGVGVGIETLVVTSLDQV